MASENIITSLHSDRKIACFVQETEHRHISTLRNLKGKVQQGTKGSVRVFSQRHECVGALTASQSGWGGKKRWCCLLVGCYLYFLYEDSYLVNIICLKQGIQDEVFIPRYGYAIIYWHLNLVSRQHLGSIFPFPPLTLSREGRQKNNQPKKTNQNH